MSEDTGDQVLSGTDGHASVRFGMTVVRALAALGLVLVAVFSVRHWFDVQFPRTLADASACVATSFFNCADSALAPIAAPFGVPLGVYGLMVAGTLVLAVLFPSAAFDCFARRLSLVNALLAASLTVYSLLGLHSLCPLCFTYTVLSLIHAGSIWITPQTATPLQRVAPALRYLAVLGAVTLLAGWSVNVHREARIAARAGGEAQQVARSFLALQKVPEPSVISSYRVISTTQRFEDAPVRMVVFGDFLCSDCRFFAEQLHRLEEEFPNLMNVAFQFFPLEARCNDVVAKDKHPGACDLARIAAYRPDRFRAIHDEIFAAGELARDRAWQLELARRHDAANALSDSATDALVRRLIATGAEYQKTSEQYAHGIRSTPTTILNGRMLIGTLPYEHLRAIVQQLASETGSGASYLERWTK